MLARTEGNVGHELDEVGKLGAKDASRGNHFKVVGVLVLLLVLSVRGPNMSRNQGSEHTIPVSNIRKESPKLASPITSVAMNVNHLNTSVNPCLATSSRILPTVRCTLALMKGSIFRTHFSEK